MNRFSDKIKAAACGLDLKKDKAIVFSFTSIVVGLISGAVITAFSSASLKSEIEKLFISFFTDFTDKSSLEIFSGIVLDGLIYFIALFISGSNIFGKEMTVILTALKSCGITAIIYVLYADYGLKGLEYVLLVFMPGKVILLFAMLFMTKFSYEFSTDLRSTNEKNPATDVYIVKSVITLIFMLISWLIDFFAIVLFSSLFTFNKQ